MRKNLRLLITSLTIACLIAVGVQLARPGTTAQITTDQKMYSVGQTMNISGTGFTPGANIIITVQNPDHSTGSVSPYPVTDATGAFKGATYTPPLLPGRYTITATDGTNTAVVAVTEADAVGYNKGVYNKNAIAPEDTTGGWTTGNAGKNYLENQWTFYQYQVTGVGSTIPDFDVVFNHFQAAKDAVFIDAFADFRACVDCTDSSFTTGNTPGMLLNTVPLPPSDTTNWVVAETAVSHINRPLNSAADGSGSTVLTGSSGFCSSDTPEPIPDGVTTFPAEFHCFHVNGATLKSLLGSSVFNSGTHTVTLFYAAHLAASFVWGNGTAGVGGHEASLGDCTSPYYAKGLTGPLSSFEPLWPSGSGACTGLPKTYGTDDYSGWTSSLFGVGFASGSSRQFSLTNQSAGPSGAITLPIPTVAAPSNTIVVVKQTVPSNATATFNYTSSQLGNFSLSNPFPSSKTFTGIAGGVEYDVNETALPGWTLTNLNCAITAGTDDGTGTWPTNSTNSTAAITLGATDNGVTLTCTYTNTGTGHIIVNKHTNPAASPQSFAYTTSGTGYTGFSLKDGQSNTDGGTPPTGGLTPGSYSVTETAVAGWTLTNLTCALTTTGSGTSTFPTSGSTANITLGAGDTVTCDYTNSQPAGSITVTPNGVNEVNHSHQFTITATQVPNGATPATTANITYAFTPSNPGTVSSTCGASVPFSGNTATCTVTVNNPSAGLFTINSTAVFTVGGVQITKTTDGVGSDSGPATKRWVDARIAVSPLTATNAVGQPHTITATVSQDDGLPAGSPGDGTTGFGPAPNGTVVNFTLLNNTAGATFVGGVNSCTVSNGLGTCTVQINSPNPGGVDIHATTTFSVGGVSLTRATGDGLSGDSANAHKDYVAGGITVTPTGVNEVNHQHIFTITATQVPGAATPATTANITYAFTPSNPGTVSSTCGASVAFVGNTATCTVTVNNPTAGVFTINATASFVVGGVTITKTTDGVGGDSGPATKTWVDANIAISPLTATNSVGQPHTITATVSQNSGSGFVAAPNGTTVTFSLTNSGGATATFVGGINTCTTTAGVCSVQINSPTAGTVTIHATTTFSVLGVSLTRATGDGLPGDSANAVKNYVSGGITVAPTGVNEVNHQHIFTITATQAPGGATPATTANITYAFTPSNPGTVSSTCGASVAFVGNNATCTVTVNNPTAGVFTINATASFVVGGVTITKTTDGVGSDSGPATKTWVDANIVLSPLTATNSVGQPHTITATVSQNTGSGFVAAPNGTLVTFSLINSGGATATFVGGVNTCNTTSGSCSVQINSPTAGNVVIHATTTFSVLGVSLTRSTGDGLSGDSVDAQKTYVSGSIVIRKITVGGFGGPFGFGTTGAGLSSFTLTTAAQNTPVTKTFSGLATGTFGGSRTITENSGPSAGWSFTSVVCSAPGSSSFSTSGATATISSLAPGDTVTCTYTNTLLPTLILVKNTVGGNGTFHFTGSGAGVVPNDLTTVSNTASQTFAFIPIGAKSLTETVPNGWVATGASCTVNNVGDGTTVIGSPTSTNPPVTAGNTVSTPVTNLGAGAVVTCTFQNSLLPTLTIVKTVEGTGTATFTFPVTDNTNSGNSFSPTITPPPAPSTATYPPGPPTPPPGVQITLDNYTINESPIPAGYTLTDFTCTGYSGGGTGAGPLDSNGIPTSWNFTANYGDNVVCTFINNNAQATRTQGFWATHTQLANDVWDGTNVAFGTVLPAGATPVIGSGDEVFGPGAGCSVAFTITAIPTNAENILMGGFWSQISQMSGKGGKRTSIDQARMQMIQQYLAAVLNVHMFGSGSEAMLATARAAYCGTDITAIKAQIGILGTFNQSGDTLGTTPGGSATSQTSKSQADIDAWDTPTYPVD